MDRNKNGGSGQVKTEKSSIKRGKETCKILGVVVYVFLLSTFLRKRVIINFYV